MSLPGRFSDCKRFWGKLIVNMFLVFKRKYVTLSNSTMLMYQLGDFYIGVQLKQLGDQI